MSMFKELIFMIRTWVIVLTMLTHLPCVRALQTNHLSNLNSLTYTYVVKTEMHTLGNAPAAIQNFVLLYKGTLELFDGVCTLIKAPHCLFTFSLIITKRVRNVYLSHSAALTHLALYDEEPYQWFDITLMMEDKKWRWKITKQTMNETPAILPEHAIILLYEPALVKTLKEPARIAYGSDTLRDIFTGFTFELPTIVIEGTAAELATADEAISAILPEVRTSHTKREQAMKIHTNCLLVCDLS